MAQNPKIKDFVSKDVMEEVENLVKHLNATVRALDRLNELKSNNDG